MDFIEGHEIDLVINVPREYDAQGRPDGFYIRRCAVDCGVPLITDLQLESKSGGRSGDYRRGS